MHQCDKWLVIVIHLPANCIQLQIGLMQDCMNTATVFLELLNGEAQMWQVGLA